jgi:hypothetical protein
MTRPAPVAIVSADYSDTGWPARPSQDDRTVRFEACAAIVQRRLGGRGPCGEPATWRDCGPRFWCDAHVPDAAVAAWRAAQDKEPVFWVLP